MSPPPPCSDTFSHTTRAAARWRAAAEVRTPFRRSRLVRAAGSGVKDAPHRCQHLVVRCTGSRACARLTDCATVRRPYAKRNERCKMRDQRRSSTPDRHLISDSLIRPMIAVLFVGNFDLNDGLTSLAQNSLRSFGTSTRNRLHSILRPDCNTRIQPRLPNTDNLSDCARNTTSDPETTASKRAVPRSLWPLCHAPSGLHRIIGCQGKIARDVPAKKRCDLQTEQKFPRSREPRPCGPRSAWLRGCLPSRCLLSSTRPRAAQRDAARAHRRRCRRAKSSMRFGSVLTHARDEHAFCQSCLATSSLVVATVGLRDPRKVVRRTAIIA